MPLSADLQQSFQQQLDFFKNKLNLPTDRYDDILKSAHDRAFIVAGAANADLLNDLNGAIRASIADGRGLEAFRKAFNSIVLKHGWTGWTGEGSAAGYAWRTRVIYQTNMATSYAAGRWKQLNDPGLLALNPYFKYVHNDAVEHPRPIHQSWNGLVLRYDDPFWRTHFPTNGWGCQCRVTSASEKDHLQAVAAGKGSPPAGWDRIDPQTGAPVGIDQGFDYAPGADAKRPLVDFIDQKLINLDAPIGAAMYQALRPALQAEQAAVYQAFLADVLADSFGRGRVAVIGAIDQGALDWLSAHAYPAPASAEVALQDSLVAGSDLDPAAWARLPGIVSSPAQLLVDSQTGRLVYVSQEQGIDMLVLQLAYHPEKAQGEVNLLVSALKVAKEAIAAGIANGLYKVIR
ncbi:phage minor head protein [Undibacterium sp. TJN25]|uniref:phage head morphogenesis protein n=1 Tax=Undibacterium sp. TJN25 TaxID=3413056 RepID=UPI003BF37980